MPNPEIVILEGDRVQRRVCLRELMDADDYAWWRNADTLSGDDLDYLNTKYPEMMGVWATIASVAGKVVKGVGKGAGAIIRRIAKRVRERREARKGKSQEQQYTNGTAPAAPAPAPAPAPAAYAPIPDARLAAVSTPDMSKMLPLIIGAAALILLTQRGKK